MASRARFGRLPRAAPSLTATIVALAAQYQQVRESNIVDAWKNGGEFEGHHVTDKQIMAWWKARRDELAKGDPKWDYYDNQIREYEFAIANSKMELQYKRGNVSDMGMAHFYHQWAGKLPTDSEAYREREKLAAGYEDRAKAGRAASGRAAADRAYGAKITGDYKKEYAYDATLAFLTSEAHNRGILQGGESIGDIDPDSADGHAINALWDEIATSPDYAGERRFFTTQIKKYGDPNFKGDFSHDAFNAYARTKGSAVDDRILTAKNAGRKGDTNAFSKDKDNFNAVRIITSGWDETAMYEDARKSWLDTVNDPNATPLAIDRANAKYTDDLTKIRDRLRSQLHPGETDDRLGAVNNELKTMSGDTHPYMHWGGMFGPGPNASGADATDTANSINANKQAIDLLSQRDANGQPLYVLTKTSGGPGDPAGKPVATTPQNHLGTRWGVVPIGLLDPTGTVFVVQNEPGDPRSAQIITAVGATPIFTVSDVLDTNGNVTKKKSDNPAGYFLTMPDGTTGYKFQDSAGKWKYTPDNPFGVPTRNAAGAVGTQELAPYIDSSGGTITIPGAPSAAPPGPAAITNPSYYNSEANKAMASRVGNNGYSLWLIASDPKSGAVYAQTPEEIVRTLALQAQNDPSGPSLAEMVGDVDAQRAVYLGNSSIEQNRIRSNYLTGTPGIVPLTNVMTGLGLGPSREAGLIGRLTAGGADQVVDDIRETNRIAAMSQPLSGGPDKWVGAPDERTSTLAPSPVLPFTVPHESPTSLGAALPGTIASQLVNVFNIIKPGLPAAVLGYQAIPPAGAGSYGSESLRAPGAAAPPPPVRTPPPAPPPPPTPAPPPNYVYVPPGGTSGSAGRLPSTGGMVGNPYYNPGYSSSTGRGKTPT